MKQTITFNFHKPVTGPGIFVQFLQFFNHKAHVSRIYFFTNQKSALVANLLGFYLDDSVYPKRLCPKLCMCHPFFTTAVKPQK